MSNCIKHAKEKNNWWKHYECAWFTKKKKEENIYKYDSILEYARLQNIWLKKQKELSTGDTNMGMVG